MIAFTWKRCADGYEIRKNDHGMDVVAPRSTKFVATEPLKENPTAPVRRFATLDSPDAFAKFADDFGLLTHRQDPEPVVMLETARDELALAVSYWTKGLAGDLERLINSPRFDFCRLTLQVRDGVPVFVPANLKAALWTQLALAVRQNEQHRACKWCGTFFAYGPGTGRRNTAEYCRPKCQMAAAYAERKAAAVKPRRRARA